MKRAICGACIVSLLTLGGLAQTPGPSDQDKAAIRQAAYDYAEGYLEGAADRMERAVHPAIVKRGAVSAPGSGPMLVPMNAETLVDASRNNAARPVPPEKRNLSFQLLDVRENVASARIFTAQFEDYLHLVKQDGRWRIANVLWQPPATTGAAEGDKTAVGQVMKEYLEASAAGDAARLERLTHPEAAIRLFRNGQATGRPFLMDTNRDMFVTAARGKQLPPFQGGTVTMIDTRDTIASVAVSSPALVSYWHLVKQNEQWRVVNGLLWMAVPPAPASQAPRR